MTGAERLADAVWSRIVRSLSELCVACRRRPTTDAAHVLPKGRHPAVRWTVGNGMPLCRECHVWYTRRPRAWRAWAEGRIGEDGYEALRALSAAKGPRPEEALAVLSEVEARLRARRAPSWLA